MTAAIPDTTPETPTPETHSQTLPAPQPAPSDAKQNKNKSAGSLLAALQEPIRLEQWHWLFGKRIFTLDAQHNLIIEERTLLRRCRTTLPLAILHPAPTYASSFSLLWLVNTLFMGALSILLFHWSNVYAIPGLPVLGILFAVFGLFTAYRFAAFTTQLTIFRHRHSNEHLVYLWRKRPDNERFNHFIAALRKAIEST